MERIRGKSVNYNSAQKEISEDSSWKYLLKKKFIEQVQANSAPRQKKSFFNNFMPPSSSAIMSPVNKIVYQTKE